MLFRSGREWRDWFGKKSVIPRTFLNPGILKVSSDDGRHWIASFVPSSGRVSKWVANAALLESELSSDVKAGENQGRHLTHDFAALALVNQALGARDHGFSGEFSLEPDPKLPHGHLALAVWITRAGALDPVQAVGGWLDVHH